ncbi:hypothetical protein F4861DRAFT_494240, partial [Xylaria intraflava]
MAMLFPRAALHSLCLHSIRTSFRTVITVTLRPGPLDASDSTMAITCQPCICACTAAHLIPTLSQSRLLSRTHLNCCNETRVHQYVSVFQDPIIYSVFLLLGRIAD